MSVINMRRGPVKGYYLSDSLTNWYGSWAAGGGAAAPTISYTGLPTGDCLAKIVFTSDGVNRFRYSGFVFNEYQNLTNYNLSFYYKFSRNEGVGHVMWIYTVSAPYSTPSFEKSNAFLNPTPTTWTLFSDNVSNWLPASSGPKLQNNSMEVVAKYAPSIYGFAFTGATTLEIARCTFRRL